MGESRRRTLHTQQLSPQARRYEAITEVGKHLNKVFNGQGKKEIGFLLLVFPIGTGITSDLVSNAEAGQGLAVMRAKISEQERKNSVQPAGDAVSLKP